MVRSPRRGAIAALATAVLLVPSLAAAQSSSNTPGMNATGTDQATTPSASATTSRTMAQLQREALRLTLIARLPAADRQQAGQLLDRADALRLRARDLRRQELQAYVDALKAGAAPADARAQAQQKVAGDRTSLTQDESALRTDVQAFLQKVPQARALLRFIEPGRVAGAPGHGRGIGAAPGWGLHPGMGPDARQPGMRQPRMAPRGNRGGMGWGRPGPGWDRDTMPSMPYGPYGAPRNGTPPATPPSSTPPSGNGGT